MSYCINALCSCHLQLSSLFLNIGIMLRLRVVEYFDSVINEIDLFTEKKIQSDETEPGEDWWNKRRQEQIDQVREMERACLSHVSSLKVKEIESGELMKIAFVEYCFTIEWRGLLFVVKANRYVEPKERQFLKMRVDSDEFVHGVFNTRIFFNDEKSLFMKFYDQDSTLQDQFLSESSIIDISSWLTKCKIVKKADSLRYTNYGDGCPIQFDDGLQIQNLECGRLIGDSQQENKAIEFIKCLEAHHPHHIENITVALKYHNWYPSLTIECLQSINFCKRIDIYFYTNHPDTDDYWSWLKSWKPIEGIKYWRFSILETTKIVDFDQLALTSMYLDASENADCSALGPIRTSLEDLNVFLPDKVLSMPFELLSGWANLNKLRFDLTETMLTTDHLIDLPALEEMLLSLDGNEIVQTTKLRFKVPKLSSLKISFYCKFQDWSSFLSSFSHVKKLSIYSKDDQIVRNGWFRGFHNVLELSLNLNKGHIDSQLFIGLENLTYLELFYRPETSLDRRALHNLVKLKMISFIDRSNGTEPPQETQDKSLFDGLYSLQSIHHGRYFTESPQSFVYFENLSRHILVTYSQFF